MPHQIPRLAVHVQHWWCMYTNAASLRNKLPELQQLIAVHKPHIVAIVETWLQPDVCDQEVHIPTYVLHRKDRRTGLGGGIVAYIREDLQVSLHEDQFLREQPDSLWIKLVTSDRNHCLTLGVIYRSPSADAESNLHVNLAIKKACESGKSAVLVMGDFNYPTIDFHSGYCRGIEASAFYELTQELGLTEHVQQPTRWRDGQNPSRLDLVLSNEPHLVDKIELSPPLGASDHATIHIRIVGCVKRKPHDRVRRRNFWKADYAGMKNHFASIAWPSVDAFANVDAHWEFILNQLHRAIENYVPLHVPNRKRRNGCLTLSTKRLIRKKKLLWDTFQLMQDTESRQAYKAIRNKCTAAVKADHRSHQIRLADTFATCPKKFYRHVSSITKSRPAISSLEGPNGLTESSQESASLLQQQYCAVYQSEPNMSHVADTSPVTSYSPPSVIPDFSASRIRMKMSQLKADKSPGLDMIPPIMLKECAEQLAEPLSELFASSYRLGTIPNRWRLGVISPIYKGGDRTNPNNYRPIALLSCVSKVMECVIDDAYRCTLNQKRFFAAEQHGFRRGRSCVTNLLTTHDQWTEAADAGKPIDAVFLDFTKAFDRVNHSILLQKASDAGLDFSAIRWLSNYLCNRQYVVRVDGVDSAPFDAPTGVPQGSILGPLLFLIFVNDLPRTVQSLLVLYADDVKISRVIESDEDEDILQQDLHQVNTWSVDNHLNLNASKCHVINIRNPTPRTYLLGENALTRVETERDLGTVVSSDLSLTSNTMQMAKKANARLAILSRVLGKFSPTNFRQMYTTLLRPMMETNISVCSPFLARDIRLLESVQRRATKRVTGMHALPYEERLARLKLFPLVYRRARSDLIQAYKILSIPDHPNRDVFQTANTSCLRGHRLKLYIKPSRLQCRQHSFTIRVCQLWNALPEHTATAESLDQFKTEIDEWMRAKWPIVSPYTDYNEWTSK